MKSLQEYDRPSVTTDMVLLRVKKVDCNENKKRLSTQKLEVLLVKRDIEPEKDALSLPGGFVEIDEGIKENVKRKVREKTGYTGSFYIEQLFTFGKVSRDPRGRVISVSYIGLCNEETIQFGGTLCEVDWYDVDEVLSGKFGDLAFDHADILLCALDRLKNKIEYTDIAFHLLPTEFTISELQTVYELILGKPILNFRRKVADMIEACNKKTEGKQYRPAELYRKAINKESRF